MTFDEVLAQVLELLQREGRVSYRALKRRFGLDEAYLEDLKEEIIAAKQLAIDEGGRVLVWTGTSAPPPVREREPAPLAFTPSYLTEKILTSRTALEGERKQITVLFADIQGSTELIAGLDPEEARQILDPVLHLMMDAVHRYEGYVGPPGANDRFFTVRRNSGRISPCLPYHTAFKNKRIRETSPERVGIRWDISSPLCPLPPRFSSL